MQHCSYVRRIETARMTKPMQAMKNPKKDWFDDGAKDQFDDFEQDVGYYGASDDLETLKDVGLLADEYETVFASFMAARKRFHNLKLARGYLLVVALQNWWRILDWCFDIGIFRQGHLRKAVTSLRAKKRMSSRVSLDQLEKNL